MKHNSKNKNKLSNGELSSFCGQVAMILESGIPLYDGMETLAAADSVSEHADMFAGLSSRVTATGSLYEALKEDSRWPSYLVEMAGVGEQSGQLDKVMRGLESYYAREDRIRSSVTSAIIYPLILGVMLVVIVFILLWRVMPVFENVVNSMGLSMDTAGGGFMKAGIILGWVIMIAAALAIIVFIICLILLKTGYRDKVISLIRKVFPGMKKIQRKLDASRIAGVLSMVLSGGFDTGTALEMTAAVIENKETASKVERVRTETESGVSLSQALVNTQLFDDLQNRMIIMSSATGSEAEVLGRIAALNEEQAGEDISRVVSIIEPVLVALLAIIIGALLLSVMLSMTGVLTGVLS